MTDHERREITVKLVELGFWELSSRAILRATVATQKRFTTAWAPN
jgi:hypothetical protein